MKFIEKMKIRTFGPRTFRTRSSFGISAIVLGATFLFVGMASASLGIISVPSWLSLQKEKQPEVQGITVQQLIGNCPANGLVTQKPSTAKPLPFSNTISQGQTSSLPAGQYYVTGTFTINGTLNINGAVEIYADKLIVGATGFVNATATGVNGGTGGIVTHTANLSTGAILSRTVTSLATDGVGYCTNGQPGCDYTTNNAGGGASKANYVNPDGAGGGGHAGVGGGGSNYSGQPGGVANYAGQPGDYDVRMGSGGGGGYCQNGGNQCRGGRGGGSVEFYTTDMTIATGARIFADGQAAPNVTHVADTPRPAQGISTGWQQASGGGGAGGGILLSAINMNVSGTLSAKGGKGGNSCTNATQCPDDDDAGGGGGGGEIKVFHDPSGTYAFSAAVNTDGGQPGSQVKPNLPQAGAGGFTTTGSCPAAPPPKCTTGWNFGVQCNAFTPEKGKPVYIGATVNSFDFQNQPLDITVQLNQYETRSSTGIVYGDWWGPKFTATKGHYYKACYDMAAGAGAQPMPWGNSYAATATRFYTDAVTPSSEFDIQSNIQPSGAMSRTQRIFQATWSSSATTAASYLEFRTGSYLGGWFTGDLNIDNVGVFDCGNDQNCTNVPPCSPSLVQAATNIISQPVRNGAFEGNSDIDTTNVWRHSSAAPTGTNASSYVRVLETGGNHYLQIKSSNFFSQAVDQTCTPSFPGGSCYHWHGTQPLPNADFQLYTVATLNDSAPCNTQLPNSATAKLDSCDVRQADCNTQPVACAPQIPTSAQILRPFEVCANQPATFYGLVSAPQASQGDLHTYKWSVSGGNPGTPSPTTGTPQNSNGTEPISTTFNPGSNDFTLKLDVTSQQGTTPSHDEHLINVIDCNPGAPGSYQPQPSEDIHASGRTSLSPATGTDNTKKKILDWREILGNVF